jgi:hypothetical protein
VDYTLSFAHRFTGFFFASLLSPLFVWAVL